MVTELEARVQRLEEQVRRLINIADPEKHPFTYLVLEMGVTDDQVEKIFALMEQVRKQILDHKTPMHHAEFEQRVYEIVPSHKGDYHFAESIVMCLNDTHQYTEVYDHMRTSGMNLPKTN